MNVIDLTRKLVSIRSYVDAETDEQHVAEFIFEFLQKTGLFQIEKQPVENGRFNIIAHDGHPPRLMFGCHMDTVKPSGTWQHSRFDGEIVGDYLYGLGAADMKGGIACLLHALTSFQQTEGLFLLFNVDEEYQFKGMKKFLNSYKLQPELAVFTEPGIEIKNGHRGLIEVYFCVRGVTGHASRPLSGKNAILGATRAVEYLLKQLEDHNDPVLGKSSCNLAYLHGGIDRGTGADGQPIIEEEGNKIPDIAEVVLDLRPATSSLRSQTVLDIIQSYLTDEGYVLERSEKRLDYGSLYVAKDRLQIFEAAVRDVLGTANYADISSFGYGEAQMLNEQQGVNCVYFGPGPDVSHQVDEHVSITELKQVTEVYKRLIEKYCVG